ncbi:MAG TPA: hypothetical protein VIJ40_08465 [Acidimicrobiales bacterium]
MVLGLRTSGSYLAPLLAAALRHEGCEEVPWATVRPGDPPSPLVQLALRDFARSGGRLLLIDDPPTSGGSLERVVKQARTLGFQTEQICLALALFDDSVVPARLREHDAVILNWSEWDIHQRLSPDAAKSMLQQFRSEKSSEPELSPFLSPLRSSPRGHARIGYRALGTHAVDGQPLPATLVVEGSGLGYLGRHTVAVSRKLPGLTPETIGFRDGVTLRHWIDEGDRVSLDSAARVSKAVHYVTNRRTSLPVRRDASATMGGQDPAWEVVSRLLVEQPYGFIGAVLRVARLDAAMKSLLTPRRFSVVDGQTGPGTWFEHQGSMVKVNFSERAFSHLNLACYDAAYDLAGLVAESNVPTLAVAARGEYEVITGEHVDLERWLLYQWLHVWNSRRLRLLSPDVAELGVARLWQDWARERLIGHMLDEGDARYCALDIDGVLESSRLNVPVLTPSAAAGLRALHAHGYTSVLATGRSFTELEDRCLRYGLAGGVAEYGGVAYNHRTRSLRDLVDERGMATIAAVRDFLAQIEGVKVAVNFRTMVRAYRMSATDNRLALDPRTTQSVIEMAGGQLRAEVGLAQTDFVLVGVDKSIGLKALMALLGASGEAPVFAVGDSACDVPMLNFAERGFMPSHARRIASGKVRTTKLSYQRGFAEAVGDFLGHAPHTCDVCPEAPCGPAGAVLLSTLLSGLEGGLTRALTLAPEMIGGAQRVIRRGQAI